MLSSSCLLAHSCFRLFPRLLACAPPTLLDNWTVRYSRRTCRWTTLFTQLFNASGSPPEYSLPVQPHYQHVFLASSSIPFVLAFAAPPITYIIRSGRSCSACPLELPADSHTLRSSRRQLTRLLQVFCTSLMSRKILILGFAAPPKVDYCFTTCSSSGIGGDVGRRRMLLSSASNLGRASA